jgi:hypothetical protein
VSFILKKVTSYKAAEAAATITTPSQSFMAFTSQECTYTWQAISALKFS